MNFWEQIGIIEREITPLDPSVIFRIGDFPIANTTLTILLIALGLLVFSLVVRATLQMRPSGFQAVIEILYEEIVKLIDQITNSRHHSNKIFPLIGAMLVYLTVANLVNVIPGLTDIMVGGKPLFRSPTADFNTTFGLAFGSVVVINLLTLKKYGIFAYLGQFFKIHEVFKGFRQSISKGFVAIVEFFVGLLDIIGELAKIISLSLRLFGNMYAGQVLMIILFGAVSLVIPSLWLAMNIFVGILQALVFAALVAAYYMLAVGNDTQEDTNQASQEVLEQTS